MTGAGQGPAARRTSHAYIPARHNADLIRVTGERAMGSSTGVGDRLAEPFRPAELKFKPQCVKGDRALAVG